MLSAIPQCRLQWSYITIPAALKQPIARLQSPDDRFLILCKIICSSVHCSMKEKSSVNVFPVVTVTVVLLLWILFIKVIHLCECLKNAVIISSIFLWYSSYLCPMKHLYTNTMQTPIKLLPKTFYTFLSEHLSYICLCFRCVMQTELSATKKKFVQEHVYNISFWHMLSFLMHQMFTRVGASGLRVSEFTSRSLSLQRCSKFMSNN